MKNAVITGAASGFGRALALTLAKREGWKILIADINRHWHGRNSGDGAQGRRRWRNF